MREVVKLLRNKKQLARITFSFNAANLASGSYVYRLNAGDYFSCYKMDVVK